jgi:hypothetical protein
LNEKAKMETPPNKEAQVESKTAVLADAEIGRDHEPLADLEVDLATVLEDDNVEYSYESHRSPFAEGKTFSHSK